MKVINEIVPTKEIKMKNNTQYWFDREVGDLIQAREKLFLRFKKSKPSQNLIKKRSEIFMKLTLSQKELNLKVENL